MNIHTVCTMRFQSSLLSVLAFAIILSNAASAQIDEHGDHSDHTLDASRVLPPELIRGPHHQIVDPVVNYFALDQFKVQSEFGDFEAHGQLILRIKLREVESIAILREQTKGKVLKQTVVRQGKKTLESAAEVAKHPILAAKGITAGIKNRFFKIKRDVEEDIETARSGESAQEKGRIYANRWLGVDKAKRRWAAHLMIDPYTSNPVLREELTRVAELEASSEIGTKLLLPSIPGTSFMKDVFKLVTEIDERELLEHNTRIMQGLGVPKAAVDEFLTHPNYSPTAASMLIAGIAALEGVDNRLVLAAQAASATSDVEAMFFLESVAMAYWFHENHTPLKRLVMETGLPAGITNDGRVVVFAAVDFPHWSNELSAIMQDMAAAYDGLAPNHELYLAGNASGNFRVHVEDLGWSVNTHMRDEYLSTVFPWAVVAAEKD